MPHVPAADHNKYIYFLNRQKCHTEYEQQTSRSWNQHNQAKVVFVLHTARTVINEEKNRLRLVLLYKLIRSIFKLTVDPNMTGYCMRR